MSEFLSVLGRAISLPGLVTAAVLGTMVLLAGYVFGKTKRTKKARPGHHMLYEAPGKTAAECRGLLSQNTPQDLFAYSLEPARGGGWYWHLTRHNPTNQVLDTVFLLQFEGEQPARFSLSFVREAFGNPDPLEPEAMLDEFFLEKLGAGRIAVEAEASS